MNCTPALIMIDMQKAFLDSASSLCVPSALETVPACGELIDFCHGAGIPVFFVTRRYRADGSDVEHCRYSRWLEGGKPLSEDCPDRESAAYPEEFNVLPGDYHIIKPRFSAFFQTELDMILRRMGADTVILAGTTTPNCIRTSCYDALSLEYNAVVVSDCSSSATEDIQRGNLRDMKNIGAEIVSLEELKRGLEINNTVQQLHRLMEIR
jgi:nicotinamidase-related amidase